MSKQGQIIPPEAYPQMVSKAEAAALARALRSPAIAEHGGRAMGTQSAALRTAVHALVDAMEKAGADDNIVAATAHEIRGLAENAGLVATGRIANGLCRYFDEVGQLGLGADAAIVHLHVSAILRATRNPDEAAHQSDAVARELAVLVSHKLTEIKTLIG